MRIADCPTCGWTGYIQDAGTAPRPTCPRGCTSDDRPVTLRPHLHIPYDPDLFAELNVGALRAL